MISPFDPFNLQKRPYLDDYKHVALDLSLKSVALFDENIPKILKALRQRFTPDAVTFEIQLDENIGFSVCPLSNYVHFFLHEERCVIMKLYRDEILDIIWAWEELLESIPL